MGAEQLAPLLTALNGGHEPPSAEEMREVLDKADNDKSAAQPSTSSRT